MAPQGHSDCGLTVECTPPDCDELKLGGDNSLLESDWEKRTIIVPIVHWEHKKSNRCIRDSNRASRKGSGRNTRKRGKREVAPAECESGNVPREIFVPTISDCD